MGFFIFASLIIFNAVLTYENLANTPEQVITIVCTFLIAGTIEMSLDKLGKIIRSK